jgi:hypothetical protein
MKSMVPDQAAEGGVETTRGWMGEAKYRCRVLQRHWSCECWYSRARPRWSCPGYCMEDSTTVWITGGG